MTEACFRKELLKALSKDGVAVVIHKIKNEPDDEDVLIEYVPGEPSYIIFGNYIGKKCKLSSARKDWYITHDDCAINELIGYVENTLRAEGLVTGTIDNQLLLFDNVEIIHII